MSTRTSHVAPHRWRCAICPAEGHGLSRDLAAKDYLAHWITYHQEDAA